MTWEYGKGEVATEEEFEAAGPLMRMAMVVDAIEHRLMFPPFQGTDNGDGTLTFRRHCPFAKEKDDG